MKVKVSKNTARSLTAIFGVGILILVAGFLLPKLATATDHEREVEVFIKPDSGSPGTVTSSPAGIDCPGTCTAKFPDDTDLTLTRTTTDSTTKFQEWFPTLYEDTVKCQEGNDTGKNCTFNIGSASTTYQASAKWSDWVDLKVTTDPTSASPGSISLSPGGYTCTGTCTYKYGNEVDVTANYNTTNSKFEFIRWDHSEADCGGSSSCAFKVRGFYNDEDSIAGFWDWENYIIKVNKKGSGNGRVTTSPSGINCGSDCSGKFSSSLITFTAEPASGSKFAGWGTSSEGSDLCLSASKGSQSRNMDKVCEDGPAFEDSQTVNLAVFFESDGSSGGDSGTSSDTGDTTQTTQEQEEDANNNSENTNDKTVAEKIGIKNLTINGEDIFASEQLPVYDSGQALTFSGKTKPNATLNLYIFSEPREATVKADDKGNWTYTIEGLEPGEHHVEAEVVDPKTNKPSKRVTVAAFNIAQSTSSGGSTQQPTAEGSTSLLVIGGLLAAMMAAGFGGAFFYLKKTNQLHPLLKKLKIKMDNLSSRFSR